MRLIVIIILAAIEFLAFLVTIPGLAATLSGGWQIFIGPFLVFFLAMNIAALQEIASTRTMQQRLYGLYRLSIVLAATASEGEVYILSCIASFPKTDPTLSVLVGGSIIVAVFTACLFLVSWMWQRAVKVPFSS